MRINPRSVYRVLLLALAWMAGMVSAWAQPTPLSSTEFTRQLLTNGTAAGARATLGISATNFAISILPNLNSFATNGGFLYLKDGGLATNLTHWGTMTFDTSDSLSTGVAVQDGVNGVTRLNAADIQLDGPGANEVRLDGVNGRITASDYVSVGNITTEPTESQLVWSGWVLAQLTNAVGDIGTGQTGYLAFSSACATVLGEQRQGVAGGGYWALLTNSAIGMGMYYDKTNSSFTSLNGLQTAGWWLKTNGVFSPNGDMIIDSNGNIGNRGVFVTCDELLVAGSMMMTPDDVGTPTEMWHLLWNPSGEDYQDKRWAVVGPASVTMPTNIYAARLFATNATLVGGTVIPSATSVTAPTGTTVTLWNSNGVLYGVSSTKTNVISDLR